MDISGWISNLFGQVGDFFSSIVNAILLLLPDSPFVMIDTSEYNTLLGNINYFIPFQSMLGILEGWIVAVGIYMIYQAALRWFKFTG